MTAAELVRTRLLSLAPVTALVSTRVYNVNWPETPTLPAVRVNLISDPRRHHLRGPDRLNKDRVQVDCIGATKVSADAVKAAVVGNGLGDDATGMDGFAGTVSGVAVSAVFCEPSGVPSDYKADELRQYMSSVDLIVHWRET